MKDMWKLIETLQLPFYDNVLVYDPIYGICVAALLVNQEFIAQPNANSFLNPTYWMELPK